MISARGLCVSFTGTTAINVFPSYFLGVTHMYTIKGFAHIGALVDNATAVVAPIGELAPIGMTYAREKAYYTNSSYPAVSLTVFSAKDDQGVSSIVDGSVAGKILEAINWIYTKSVAGHFSNDIAAFETLFLNNFSGNLGIARTGTMIRYGSVWCPEAVEIVLLGLSIDTKANIWFSSEAFLNQYDEMEIRVVPPLANLDHFFDLYTNVKTKTDLITTGSIVERAEVLADRYPYTRLRIDTFDWVNPLDPSIKIPVDWPSLLYGVAGDNLDSVKELLVEYILENSTHSREEWTELFPDLFTSTEFIITPFWNSYAIPNRVLESGMYSPVINTNTARTLVKKTTFGNHYTETWIVQRLDIAATTYKSLAIGIVGGPDNRDAGYHLTDNFEDYLLVSSVHPDFHRMSSRTREFVLMLTEMLRIAEEATPYTTVPIGYTRIKRNGIYYIARSYERIQYLVVTKYSVANLPN